jgi:hypothetical protein
MWTRGVALTLIVALASLSPRAARAAAPEGTIDVVSAPAGAAVYLNGEPRGVTPLILDGVAAGEHRVRVVKDGFLENSRVVTVQPGRSATVDLRMTQAPAPTGQSPGWTTKKKAIVGGAAAAVIIGGILLIGGGQSTPDNTAPVAGSIAVSPTGTGLAGATNFVFTATGSSDAENDPLTYAWTFGDGSSGAGATASHVYNAGGTFSVTLTVSDGTQSATAASRSVQVRDVNGTWVNISPQIGNPDGIQRRVRFTQSGAQISGTYRTNLAPGATGSVTGTLASPRNLTFEARLKDAEDVQVGFTFEGSFNESFTAFTGTARGYLLGERGRSLIFGREAE